MKIEGNTKFNIGDICCGFVDNDIHTLRIDRIEVYVETNSTIKTTNIKVIYFATVIDSKINLQYRLTEDQLFNDEKEVVAYITNYFENRKIVVK